MVPHSVLSEFASQQTVDDGGTVDMSVIYVFVSVANNFVRSSLAADHGYHFLRELARSIERLLQKK